MLNRTPRRTWQPNHWWGLWVSICDLRYKCGYWDVFCPQKTVDRLALALLGMSVSAKGQGYQITRIATNGVVDTEEELKVFSLFCEITFIILLVCYRSNIKIQNTGFLPNNAIDDAVIYLPAHHTALLPVSILAAWRFFWPRDDGPPIFPYLAKIHTRSGSLSIASSYILINFEGRGKGAFCRSPRSFCLLFFFSILFYFGFVAESNEYWTP